MTRRKHFLTAFICIILSIITVFCFAFTGCAEYVPPENGGGDSPLPEEPNNPENPDDPENPEVHTKGLSVQLVVKNGSVWQNFTYDFYEDSDGMGGAHKQGWIDWDSIKIQWTDLDNGARYFAGLDKEGKAVCEGLDGDFKVTIMNIPTGFTYECNENYTDSINNTSIDITLYQIQKTGATIDLYYNDGITLNECVAYNLKTTGVYRAVLESREDRVMYAFQTNKQGTYSLTTLVDVTEDKVNPKLTVYNGNLANKAIYHFQDKDDGGASNLFTKNIMWEYYISADETKGGNALIFELYSVPLDGDDGYPLTVDFLIQRDGDYTRPDTGATFVDVTEDFTKTPAQPEGTFTWASHNPENTMYKCDSKLVILNTEEGREAEYLKNKAGSGFTVEMGTQATLNDGYYYFYDYDEGTKKFTLTDRLYAVINKGGSGEGNNPNQIVDLTDYRINFSYLNGHNYVYFLSTYREHCNSDGAYPVNAELAMFLYDYCIQYAIFNDGYGLAESGTSYIADENGMWLFLSAYYRQ